MLGGFSQDIRYVTQSRQGTTPLKGNRISAELLYHTQNWLETTTIKKKE